MDPFGSQVTLRVFWKNKRIGRHKMRVGLFGVLLTVTTRKGMNTLIEGHDQKGKPFAYSATEPGLRFQLN